MKRRQGACQMPDDTPGQKEDAYGSDRKTECNGESRTVEKEGRLVDEGEGDKKTGDAQPEGLHSGRHWLRAGEIGRCEGRHGIRRGQVRKHSIVEDKEVGCDQWDAQLGHGMGADGDGNDIGGGGRDACSNDADDQEDEDHGQ